MHDIFARFLTWFIQFAVVAAVALLVAHLAVRRSRNNNLTGKNAADPGTRRRVRGALSWVAVGTALAVGLPFVWNGVPGWVLAGTVLSGGLVGMLGFRRRGSGSAPTASPLACLLERTALRVGAGLDLNSALAESCLQCHVTAPASLIGPQWLAWLRGVDGDRTLPAELRDGLELPSNADRVNALWNWAVAVRQRDADVVREQARGLAAEARRPWLWCVAPAVYVWLLGPAMLEFAGYWERFPNSSQRVGQFEETGSPPGPPRKPGCPTCQTSPLQP